MGRLWLPVPAGVILTPLTLVIFICQYMECKLDLLGTPDSMCEIENESAGNEGGNRPLTSRTPPLALKARLLEYRVLIREAAQLT